MTKCSLRTKAIYYQVTARSSRSVTKTEQLTEPQAYSFFLQGVGGPGRGGEPSPILPGVLREI